MTVAAPQIVAAAMAQAGANASAAAVAVMAITQPGPLMTWAIIGSVMGAIISVALFPPKSLRDQVRKGIVSCLAGFAVTPYLALKLGTAPDPEMAMMLATAGAFASWSVLRAASPALSKLGAKLGMPKMFGGGDDFEQNKGGDP